MDVAKPKVERVGEPGAGRRVTRLVCRRCGAQETRAYNWQTASSDTIARIFSRSGWDVDRHNLQRSTCPSCNGRRPKAVAVPKEVPPMAAPEKPPIEKLTPDQRALVRRYLDEHFDDSKGVYLDQYNDKRIGEEAKVPWAAVRDLRETAYGPIRVNPETQAALEEVTALRVQLDAANASWRSAIDAILARLGALEKRLSAPVP